MKHLKCLILRVVQYTQLEAIRLWYLWFDKPEIDSWTLFHTVDLDFEGGLKMLSIRVHSIESTWIVRIDWGLWPCFKNEEGSCIVILRILTSGGLCRVGWECCRFESTRIVSPVVDSSCRKLICEKRAPCESSRHVTCELSWIVKCFKRIDSVSVYWTWMLILANEAQEKSVFLTSVTVLLSFRTTITICYSQINFLIIHWLAKSGKDKPLQKVTSQIRMWPSEFVTQTNNYAMNLRLS